jgi:hypothetical protein
MKLHIEEHHNLLRSLNIIEIGELCSKRGREQKFIQDFGEVRDPWEDQDEVLYSTGCARNTSRFIKVSEKGIVYAIQSFISQSERTMFTIFKLLFDNLKECLPFFRLFLKI